MSAHTVKRDRSLRAVLGSGRCITCGGDVCLWEPYRYPTGCVMCERCAVLPSIELRVRLLDHVLFDCPDVCPQPPHPAHLPVCCAHSGSPDFRVALSEASEWEPAP